MRKIKYRAWDKRLEKFAYLELEKDNQFHFTAPTTGPGEAFSTANLGEWEEYLLEDIKGNEVFERDLIMKKASSISGKYYTKKVVEIKKKGILIKGLDLIIVQDERMKHIIDYDKDFEVVGNIYENPELLK